MIMFLMLNVHKHIVIWIQSYVGSYQCDINPVTCFDYHVKTVIYVNNYHMNTITCSQLSCECLCTLSYRSTESNVYDYHVNIVILGISCESKSHVHILACEYIHVVHSHHVNTYVFVIVTLIHSQTIHNVKQTALIAPVVDPIRGPDHLSRQNALTPPLTFAH